MQIDDETEQRLAIRKREALEIDPDTAEIDWCYSQILDGRIFQRNATESSAIFCSPAGQRCLGLLL
jgi:hypothetical protein